MHRLRDCSPFPQTIGALENAIDEETENWPVSSDLRDDLDDIKRAYRASPLRVFAHGKFVEVSDVNNVIEGAPVELHFALFHFGICKKNEDSFNGMMEQVLMIQPGEPRPATVYKRKNVRDRPIRLPRLPPALTAEGQ